MFNPYVVIPLVVWLIAQFTKFVVAAAQGRVDFKYLYASGGMPSVHAAVVTSLAVTAFLIDGPNSAIFGITVILAAIVMYDSFGVRRSSGEQAVAINVILDSMTHDKIPLSHPQTRLREILGHKPLEVTLGATLGFVLACIFNADKLEKLWAFLTHPITQQQAMIMGGVALFLFVCALVGRFVYLRRFKKIHTAARAIKRSFWTGTILSIITGSVAFLAYEKVEMAQWLVWPMLLALTLLVALITLIRAYNSPVKAAIAETKLDAEKQKWFEGPNKKRRAAKERSKKRR